MLWEVSTSIEVRYWSLDYVLKHFFVSGKVDEIPL